MTAAVMREKALETMNEGSDWFVSKPFRVEEIHEILATFDGAIFEKPEARVESVSESKEGKAPDFNNIILPLEIADQLKKSAELCEVTQMVQTLENLRVQGEREAVLADYLDRLLGSYDMEGILAVMNKVKTK